MTPSMSNEPKPSRRTNPEIEPSPDATPSRFPVEPTPMDQQAAGSPTAKPKDSDASSSRLGSGEDPSVESGTDKNDPEQTATGDDEVEKSFE